MNIILISRLLFWMLLCWLWYRVLCQMMKCILQFVIALFQEEILKLLGCIFEEVYGEAVDSSIDDSELSTIDTTNSVDSCRQVACSSQPTVVNVTDTCAVMRQPSAADAEVRVSGIQPSTVCDVVIQPTVSSSSVPLEPSESTSDVVIRQSDVARGWSTGTLLTDSSGKSVEVVWHVVVLCHCNVHAVLLCTV